MFAAGLPACVGLALTNVEMVGASDGLGSLARRACRLRDLALKSYSASPSLATCQVSLNIFCPEKYVFSEGIRVLVFSNKSTRALALVDAPLAVPGTLSLMLGWLDSCD